MRLSTTLGLCMGLLLSTTACDPFAENRLIREGIGTDLYTSALPGSTALADAYVAHICRQAGLAREGETCDNSALGRQWATFVQAGLNDVDRRCDGYLAWLDDRKRSQTPILNQLHALNATTIGIMNATGVGANPITIVGLAFGLAADTFTNVQSRLLLEANHSTVQAVVLGNQSEYRAQIISKAVDNKPAAIYLLRGYLRICMPFSIETSMNNTLTVYHRSGPDALKEAPIFQRPALISSVSQVRTALRESIPSTPRQPLQGGGPKNPPLPDVEPKMTGTDFEKNIPQSIGRVMQMNLCIMSPTSSFESARDAIQQAKTGANQTRTRLFANTTNEIVNVAEVQLLLNATLPPCVFNPSEVGPQTAYEKFRFPDEAAVMSLQQILKICDTRLEGKISGKFDATTRDAIAEAKRKISSSRRLGLTDLSVKTLRSNSFDAIRDTCN